MNPLSNLNNRKKAVELVFQGMGSKLRQDYTRTKNALKGTKFKPMNDRGILGK